LGFLWKERKLPDAVKNLDVLEEWAKHSEGWRHWMCDFAEIFAG